MQVVKTNGPNQMYLDVELCTRGLCVRFAKLLNVCKHVPEVRILSAPLRNIAPDYSGAFLMCTKFKIFIIF